MKISDFMVPSADVVTCTESTDLQTIADQMLGLKISSIVVIGPSEKVAAKAKAGKSEEIKEVVESASMSPKKSTGKGASKGIEEEKAKDTLRPVGFISKTDLVRALRDHLDPKKTTAKEIMGRDLKSCGGHLQRDEAIAKMDKEGVHHLLVYDKEHKEFLGVVSSLDLVSEVRKDAKAWPWSRDYLRKLWTK